MMENMTEDLYNAALKVIEEVGIVEDLLPF